MICTLPVVTIQVKFCPEKYNPNEGVQSTFRKERRHFIFNERELFRYTNVLCCFWMLLVCCLSERYCFCCLRLCRILQFFSNLLLITRYNTPQDFPVVHVEFLFGMLLLLISYQMLHPFPFNACLILLLYLMFSITEISDILIFVQKLCLILLILC